MLLGEEGDGKSWGTAAWLNQKISTEENFPPVIFLSSADVTSNYPQELLLQILKPHDRTVAAAEWQQQMLQWLTLSSTDNPALILVLDGINERRNFSWWRQLLESIAGEQENSTGKQKWAKLAVVVTCRIEYWQRTFNKLSNLATQSFTLQSYDDNELAEALKLNHIKRSDLSDELLKFVRKPRYFELTVTHRQILGSVEHVTIARLIYEDWRDRWRKKTGIPITDEEFRNLLRQLAEKQKSYTKSVKKRDLEEVIEGYASNPLELLEELRTGGVIQVGEGRSRLDERLLTLGLGLLLVDQLIDAYENSHPDLIEVAAKWLGSQAGIDMNAQICGMAVLHTLLVADFPQEVKITLLLVWISNQNPGDEIEATIRSTIPSNTSTFVALCDALWSTAFDNHWAQDLIISAFIDFYPQFDTVRDGLHLAIERWLGMVHIAGFPYQRGNKQEKTKEVTEHINQRVGFALQPREFTFADRTFTAVDDDNLLRLGRAALALISHFPRGPFIHSITTGCVAEAIMDHPEKYELFRWVLSTAPNAIWGEVRQEVDQLLTHDSLVIQQAAHRLLSFEGSEQAYGHQNALPADLFPEHFLYTEHRKDPCLSWFAWSKPICESCLHRSDLEAQYLARRMETHALDPALRIPVALQQRFAALAETIDISQIWSTMSTGVQDLAYDRYEAALCTVSPLAIANTVRNVVKRVATRNGLALRQISWRLREHALLFEQEELDSIYQAWQQLHQSATDWEEEQKTAEMMLFSLVLSRLSGEEQLAHLLQRPEDVNIDMLQYENYFLPINDWKLVEKWLPQFNSENGLARILWFISIHAEQIPPAFLFTHIIPYVEDHSAQVRRLAMKIICNADNRYLNFAVVGGWERRQDNLDEENRFGSLILCRHGHLLPLEILYERIHPIYWGYAIKCRGSDSGELDLFANKVHVLWKHISSQTMEIPHYLPKMNIEINAETSDEKNSRPRFSLADGDKVQRWDFTKVKDNKGNRLLPHFPTEEEINAQQARDIATVQAVIEQEVALGNSWFAHNFAIEALEDVVLRRPDLLAEWLQAVSEQNEHRLRVLRRCHAFYETLCQVLLKIHPQEGVTLYSQMEQVNISSRESQTKWKILDRALFKAEPASVVIELWEEKLKACTTDKQLLMMASMLQWGNNKNWLWDYIEQQLAANTPIGISRGTTLLGFYGTDKAKALLDQLYQNAPDTWRKQLLETSTQRWNLNNWSRHWFSQIFASDTNVEAWAAFRLFLHCVDSRFWIWYREERKVGSAYPQFEQRWRHIVINWETIRNRIRKNEDEFEKYLFGQKILRSQAWPWI